METMSTRESLTSEPTAEETAEYQAGFRRMIAQVDEIHRQMEQTQVEIDGLRRKSHLFAQESKVLAQESQQIRKETRQIAEETRRIGQETHAMLERLTGI